MAQVKRAPSMAEVAQIAGVSHQTVSRVVNDFPGVRPETRQRVQDAIATLGYRRNNSARTLATNQSFLIGVIAVGSFLFGPTHTLASLEQAARHHGYTTLLGTIRTANEKEFGDVIDQFLERSVDAIIVIAARESMSRHAEQFDNNVPIIMVGPEVEGTDSLSTLSVDQSGGARAAIRHLAQLGHNHILLLNGPEDWTDAQLRRRAALSQASELGVRIQETEGDWSAKSGFQAGIALATQEPANRPTAVFSANDEMALGLLAALHKCGINVPRDMSVVGFDNVSGTEYYTPALTTVGQDFATLGQRVIDAVLDLISGKEPDVSPVPARLIVRDSTSPAVTQTD
ncbi:MULTISPECIES: LacI family DNA-binding transcriptional regulator [Actinotignum]|uniref:LacI family DNA-binding transcriptional regulator n=1 Tax=Actinotignum timonense TaxID=1870995 RepID=A0ABU5GCS5_9ACTO|nr:LacI family DNA-binding transcriptional regulator [Actinotignum timonense]MDY5134581.1 LacI family DNA-binding transcriptional regulator [Actinotignum timonense]MDY5146587.1 LacI family DNA-binding transcriptional regulator [Actinotignum timonense]MDY5158694.1 LacI family DNA-binding transcriptional regulator [Actinotignum timonense]